MGAPQSGWEAGPGVLESALRLLPANRPLKLFDCGAGQSYLPERLRDLSHWTTAQDVVPPLRLHPDCITGHVEELDLLRAYFDLPIPSGLRAPA